MRGGGQAPAHMNAFCRAVRGALPRSGAAKQFIATHDFSSKRSANKHSCCSTAAPRPGAAAWPGHMLNLASKQRSDAEAGLVIAAAICARKRGPGSALHRVHKFPTNKERE